MVDLLVTPTTPVLPATVQEALRDPGTPPPGGVAPSLGEGIVLALAHAYEQATEWHRRRPPV
jgi:Asp-tRNA(Asn)/Glu-tRNA(Gln) amidotransferase A subunit family amidase